MVFVCFVPLGFVLNKYPFRLDTIIKSFLGQSYEYNAEWWYIGHYVRLMLLFPLVSLAGTWLGSKHKFLIHFGMLFGLAILLFAPEEVPWLGFYLVFYYFLEGMYFAGSTWFELGLRIFCKNWMRLLMGTGLILTVFVLRTFGMGDYWLVPALVFGFVLLMKNSIMVRYVGSIFLFIGKYSTYIWLTHTFFAYYYFQNVTYAPRYSWVIAIWCMLLCISSGAILEKARMILFGAFMKNKNLSSRKEQR